MPELRGGTPFKSGIYFIGAGSGGKWAIILRFGDEESAASLRDGKTPGVGLGWWDACF